MTDSARRTQDADRQRALMQRLATATEQARDATERYVEISRQCDLSVGQSRQLLAASREVREQLRDVVSSYVSILRRDGAPPERVIVLVKEAVEASDLPLEIGRRRALMEEVVRWAVDAYYAA